MRTAARAAWIAALLGVLPMEASAMEHDVAISVYQGRCAEGDFAANLATVRKVIDQAVARGSQFVCFPECFLSGYESPEAVQKGARGLDDPDLTAFIESTARHGAVVLVGLARKAPDGLYNTVLVIHRGKLLGMYDKVLLTGGDSARLGFLPGTNVPVFEAHGIRFAVQICHDSSFPHVALHARLQGAQLLFSPHNNEIGAQGADDHRLWVRNNHVGTACQMKMAVARANIVKTDRSGQVGYGDSFILSPQGTPLAEAKLFREELVTATLKPEMFRGPWVWADFAETPAWLRTQIAELLTEFRPPRDEADLAYWLENMAVYHHFTRQEMSAATGLTLDEIDAALKRHGLAERAAPTRKPAEALRVLPYPGARHPRIGFFDGALMPQRETKVSIFPPWPDGGYFVLDVPEAVWSNLGLTYLAHTHVASIWDKAGVKLPRLEWARNADGTLETERVLPNGIAFGTKVVPTPTDVRVEMWLRNGTSAKLTDLRLQNCIMLAAAPGFAALTNENKVFRPPFAAARSDKGDRWIITCFEPVQRCWGNDRVSCLHSDPQFPDCEPGATVRLKGRVWFYEGADIDAELARAARG